MNDLTSLDSGMPKELWALVGVLLGFALSQLDKWVVEYRRKRRHLKILKEELHSIRAQIPHKIMIIDQMLVALQTGKVLDGRSVAFLNTGYESVLPTIYLQLSPLERSNLHVIYERLRLADERMASFAEEIVCAVKDRIIGDPYGAYTTRLAEMRESCLVVSSLIDAYLEGTPIDVFQENANAVKTNERAAK